MIGKPEWDAAREALLAEGRLRVGPPPTVEELDAYVAGDLSPRDSDRIQELLVYYPELAQALAAPFPTEEEAKPGDPDYLSDEDLARDWKALQSRIHADEPPPLGFRDRADARVVAFWRYTSIAAMLVAALFGALLVRTQSMLHRELAASVVTQSLSPDDVQRGGEVAVTTLPADADTYALTLSLANPPHASTYRADLLDLNATPTRRIVSYSDLALHPDNSVQVVVRRSAVPPGTYRLALFGEGSEAEPLASYTFAMGPRKY